MAKKNTRQELHAEEIKGYFRRKIPAACVCLVQHTTQPQIISQDTQVILVDDIPQAAIDMIKSRRPDVRVIGFVFIPCNEETATLPAPNIIFE